MELLNSHILMKEMKGIEEAKPRNIKALIDGALMSTKYAWMSEVHIYQAFQENFLDTVNPTNAMEMEESHFL